MLKYQTIAFQGLAEEEPLYVLLGKISDLQVGVFPSEQRAIERAILKRQQEFCAGRSLAREAFRKIEHIGNMEIPVGKDRAPCWPADIVGSITHTDTHCACAISRQGKRKSIGIDMENIGAVNPELWDQIFTPSEQNHLMRVSEEERPMHASLFFCAKEAFYKLQYPLTKAWLNFTDATVHIDQDNLSILINKNTPAGQLIGHQQGYYTKTDSNSVICLFML